VSIIGITFVIVTMMKEGSPVKESVDELAIPEGKPIEEALSTEDHEDAKPLDPQVVSEDSTSAQATTSDDLPPHLSHAQEKPTEKKKSLFNQLSMFGKKSSSDLAGKEVSELLKSIDATHGGIEEAPGKKSLFNKLNIFHKKEIEPEPPSGDHFTSLKDFVAKADGKKHPQESEAAANLTESLKRQENDVELKKDDLVEQEDPSIGTASMKTGAVEQESQEEVNKKPQRSFDENSISEEPDQSKSNQEAIVQIEPDSVSSADRPMAEPGMADVPGSDDAYADQENKGEEEEPSSDVQPSPQPANSDEILEDDSDFHQEVREELDELKEKFESANQLLKEKNDILERTQKSLESEQKNREEFEKVKIVLEQELLDVKNRCRQVQKEKVNVEKESETNQILISELEEKTKILEEDLSQKTEELQQSVDRLDDLQSELLDKDSVIQEHIQNLEDLKNSAPLSESRGEQPFIEESKVEPKEEEGAAQEEVKGNIIPDVTSDNSPEDLSGQEGIDFVEFFN